MKRVLSGLLFALLIFVHDPVYAVLNSPTLLNPADNVILTSPGVTFQWSAVSGALQYFLQVAYDVNFTQIVFAPNVPFTSIGTSLPSNYWFYWRVRAFSSTQGYSAWSVVRKVKYQPVVKVDCVMSEWGPWEPYTAWDCYNTTETRQEIRTRTILVQPSGGGLACGSTTETRIATRACDYSLNMNDELFRTNYGSSDCYAELPSQIRIGVGLYALPQSTVCFDGVSSGYHDSYDSVMLGGCDYGNKVNVSSGSCLDQGVNPSGEQFGYCCEPAFPWGSCQSGGLSYTCEEMFTYARAQVPVQAVSGKDRYPMKTYLGEMEYRSGTWSLIYRLFADDGCYDGFYLSRSNDDVVVSSINQEVYQYYSDYHGQLSWQDNLIEKYVFTNGDFQYRGLIPGVFQRSDLVKDSDTVYGWTMLKHHVLGTGCYYDSWLFAGKPDYWYECGDVKKLGFNFVSSDLQDNGIIYYVDDNGYQVYRYPVDKKFQATGPIEFIGIQNPVLGYIDNMSFNDVGAGYKYRIRTSVTDIIYSVDIGGWPCMEVESSGFGTFNKGVGSNTKGIGVVNTGVGGFEKRTR